MPSWANRLAILVLMMGTPALATPPQIVDFNDTLFARNEDTLLILRQVTDNQGRHGVLQTDTFLVFRSLTDGGDRGFRAVERVVENGIDVPRAEYVPLPAPAEPYAIRADGYWPVRAPVYWREQAFMTADGLTIRDQGQPVYHLSIEALKLHLIDTTTATRGILPSLHQDGSADPFDPYAFDAVTDCDPVSILPLNDFPSDPALVKLHCQESDTGQQAGLWVVVPRAE